MTKKILNILILLLLPFMLTGCGKNYDNVKDFYNQMQLKKNSFDNMQFLLKVKLGNIKTQSLIYMSEKNLRTESSLDNGKTYPTVSIKTEGVSYVYIPLSKTAYQVSHDSDSGLDALEWGDFDLSNFSFGKRKNINGENCLEVVRYTKESKIYYCVSEKYGIPISSDITIGKDYNMTSSVQKIKTSRVSKKMFELPKGTKVIIQGK